MRYKQIVHDMHLSVHIYAIGDFYIKFRYLLQVFRGLCYVYVKDGVCVTFMWSPPFVILSSEGITLDMHKEETCGQDG